MLPHAPASTLLLNNLLPFSRRSQVAKHTKLSFTPAGVGYGASFDTFMLEKSRVTKNDEGRIGRTFHIFHRLVAGMDEELMRQLGLTSTSSMVSRHHFITIQPTHRPSSHHLAPVRPLLNYPPLTTRHSHRYLTD
jgi:hypothetical protein